jgi:hypothetical protein
MPLPAPSIRWPTELLERGPAEDATILLTGAADIAGAKFQVVALRVHPNERGPDYRDAVPATVYEESIEAMLGDIEDLTNSIAPQSILIGGDRYLLWMVPSADD